MAISNTQLYNSTPVRVLQELIYRRTDLMVDAEDIDYAVVTPDTDATASDEIVEIGNGVVRAFQPTIDGIFTVANLKVTALYYIQADGSRVDLDSSQYAVDYSGTVTLNDPLPRLALLYWTGTARQAAYLKITATASHANGQDSAYLGDIALQLTRMDLPGMFPERLVYPDAFPPTADALINYLTNNYGYYVEDGEFIIASDTSKTPIVRGGGQLAGSLDANNGFYLEATDTSMRWNPGTRAYVLNQASNSIVPAGLFTLVGTPPAGVYTQPYNYTFQTVNATGAVTYTVLSGTPPAPIDPSTGLMHSDGLTAVGSYSWTLQAQDTAGHIATKNYIMAVTIPPQMASPDTNTPVIDVGTLTQVKFNTSGGVPPYSYAITSGNFPEGFSFVGDSFEVLADGSPIPSATESQFLFTVTVTDSQHQTLSMNFNGSINDRSEATIKAVMIPKVVSWWDVRNWGATSGSMLPEGAVVYDGTAHQDLTVKAVGAGTGLPLVSISRTGAPFALDFRQSMALVASGSAYNLTHDYTIVSLVSVPSFEAIDQQAMLFDRGGNADGGYAVSVDPSSQSLNVSLGLAQADGSSLGTVTSFETKIPEGSGAYSLLSTYRYGNTPAFIINSGNPEDASDVAGNIVINNTDVLTIGANKALTVPSQVLMAMPIIFNQKLWSDELKWLWNNGQLRAYKELGAYPSLVVSPSDDLATLLNNVRVGDAFDLKLTCSQGNGKYVVAMEGSPTFPEGITGGWVSSTVYEISGTFTEANATSRIAVTIGSTDGYTYAVDTSFAVKEAITS